MRRTEAGRTKCGISEQKGWGSKQRALRHNGLHSDISRYQAKDSDSFNCIGTAHTQHRQTAGGGASGDAQRQVRLPVSRV